MSADDNTELYRLIRELTAQVHVLSVSIARIETTLAARKECPSPGMCLQLAPRVEALEHRAATSDGERAGLTIAGRAVWAIAGSGIMALGYALFRLVAAKV